MIEKKIRELEKNKESLKQRIPKTGSEEFRKELEKDYERYKQIKIREEISFPLFFKCRIYLKRWCSVSPKHISIMVF
jgi:hypothetical protein